MSETIKTIEELTGIPKEEWDDKEPLHLGSFVKAEDYRKLKASYAALEKRLAEAKGLLDRAARGGDCSPGEWAALLCEIAGFLTHQPTRYVVVRREDLDYTIHNATHELNGEPRDLSNSHLLIWAINRLKAALEEPKP